MRLAEIECLLQPKKNLLLFHLFFLQWQLFNPHYTITHLDPPQQILTTQQGETFTIEKLYWEAEELCFIIAETEQFHCVAYGEIVDLKAKVVNPMFDFSLPSFFQVNREKPTLVRL